MMIKKYLCKVTLCAALIVSGAALASNPSTSKIPDNTSDSVWKKISPYDWLVNKGLINKYRPYRSDQILPEFSSKDLLTEQTIRSHELIKTKRFTVISVWASWCPVSQLQHEKLMQLKQQHQNINFIGINTHDSPDKAKEFLRKNGNPFSAIFSDPKGRIIEKISINGEPVTHSEMGGIPVTLLVDSHGSIHRSVSGAISDEHINDLRQTINSTDLEKTHIRFRLNDCSDKFKHPMKYYLEYSVGALGRELFNMGITAHDLPRPFQWHYIRSYEKCLSQSKTYCQKIAGHPQQDCSEYCSHKKESNDACVTRCKEIRSTCQLHQKSHRGWLNDAKECFKSDSYIDKCDYIL